jgi:Tol biopolymer transport system component
VLAYNAGTRKGTRPPPSYDRLTFRSGTIRSARFSPDGESVFYSARFANEPIHIFSARADSPESRDLGIGTADLLAVSSTGQLAISLRRHPIGYLRDSGTLAQVPISGAAPREILEDVEAADWTPDGTALAVVRTVKGTCRLEYPIGTPIAESPGWIAQPRFSPDGSHIAYVHHPFTNDDRGSVTVVDLRSHAKTSITPEYDSVEGIAWSPRGDEVWTAAETGEPAGRVIVAAGLRGKTRIVASSAGWLWLHDIAPDGRLLVTQQSLRGGISILDGDAKERDLSWLDYSVVRDLSDDGRELLFSESGEAGGSIFGIYIRRTDGSPPVRLGEGTSEALSPDGRWVLSIPRDEKPAQIVMLPTGAGQPRAITNDRINHRNARFTPDGQSVLFQGNLPDAAPRLWLQPIGGAPRPVTPENVSGTLITPDGRHVLGRNETGAFVLYPFAGGTPIPVPFLVRGDVPIQFTSDGKSVFVSTFGKVPAVLTKVDLATGQRTKWKEVMPTDLSGLINVGPVWPTPDGRTIVYSYARLLSELFIVRGAQ